MLYKNNNPYQLTVEDKKQVYEFLGWEFDSKKGGPKIPQKTRPAVITYVDSMITYDAINQKKIKPSSINIPMESFVSDMDGVSKWIYSKEGLRRGEHGDLEFNTLGKYYTMQSSFSLTYMDIEFLWFLITKSTLRELSEEEVKSGKTQMGMPVFRVENKEAEAIAKLAKTKKRFEIQSYVASTWDTEKVRRFAMAYGIVSAIDMQPNELRSVLLGRLEGEPNGWERFYDMTQAEDETNIRYMIEVLKDKKAIAFDDKKREWNWLGVDGKKSGEICSHTPNYLHNEDSLLDVLKSDSALLNTFKLQVDSQ